MTVFELQKEISKLIEEGKGDCTVMKLIAFTGKCSASDDIEISCDDGFVIL